MVSDLVCVSLFMSRDYYNHQVAGSTSSGSGDAPNEVYVLLTSQRGLSRRCRAAWFLQRLGDELEEGLEDRLIFLFTHNLHLFTVVCRNSTSLMWSL